MVLPYGIVALAAYTVLHAYPLHRWGDAVFAGVNAVLATYAIVAFVGLRNSLVDIWVNLIALLYKPAEPSAARTPRRAPVTPLPAPVASDWERVLYVGSADDGQLAAPHPAKPANGEPRAFAAWTGAPQAATGALGDEPPVAAGEAAARRERYRTAGSLGLAGWRVELRRADGNDAEPGS